MAKIVLDLHDIFNRGSDIDTELNRVVSEAVEKKSRLSRSSPAKGVDNLKSGCSAFSIKNRSKSYIIAWKKTTRILAGFLCIFGFKDWRQMLTEVWTVLIQNQSFELSVLV